MISPLLILLVAGCSAITLSTDSRFIINEHSGERVKLACVNWASHMEANIPEGLSEFSVNEIAESIVDMNFTCVRYTLSNELLWHLNDPIAEYAKYPHISNHSLANIYKFNPAYMSTGTTVFDVFADTMDALQKRKLLVILDNHVSKATWCCGLRDGNRWWNREWFPVDPWVDVLVRMAQLAKLWPNSIVGVGLRNEVHSFQRPSLQKAEWFHFMRRAALAVHKANPKLLVIVGGLSSASYLRMLLDRPLLMAKDPASLQRKIVYEAHYYNLAYIKPLWRLFGYDKSCRFMYAFLNYRVGFLYSEKYYYTHQTLARAPVWFSEFGLAVHPDPEDIRTRDVMYLECLTGYLHHHDLDWGYWQLNDRYYYRQGIRDFNETWGLLGGGENVKNAWVMRYLQPLIKKRL